ncbi:ATP-binding cassette domain-containing protein [Hyphomicrobium sp. xq]|uniref:ATP-binding cassette domain-containing protein n=2 Tax=Hyphomicrobium album TaxID=2665159 RepID=A0A6I3KLN2_9HYPH|nr:ATP-binding cassette domain-containing protein [Hyphomicrobium album]
MIASTFAEVLSIGAVLPFLSVLVKPQMVFNHPAAQPVISALEITEPRGLLLPITAFFCIVVVGATVTRLALMLAQTRFGAALATDFSIAAYNRTLFQPYATHVSKNSSEVIAGVNKAGHLGEALVTPCLVILSSSFLLATILALLVWAQPIVAISAFGGFGLIYAGITLLARHRLAAEGQVINRESGRMIKALQEGLGGIRDVLIDGSQHVYTGLFRGSVAPLHHSSANILIISQSPRYAVEGLGVVLVAIITFFLASRGEGFYDAIPILGGLVVGAQRMLPAIQQAYSSFTFLRGRLPLTADALSVLEQPLPAFAQQPPPAPIPFKRTIRLDGLRFRYTIERPWVLDGLDLTIKRGEMVGFVGVTGAGKSTLIDIIMGLLEPTEGSLLVDGERISTDNQRAWQAHISHVPQAIYLADGTIAENIAFGVLPHEIDFGRVKVAARMAQIADTIEAWDSKYDTAVGERGVRLSGGQRQRIGIARALYKRADVIILDEATSALDNETEQSVMAAIDGFGAEVTIIMIAHRLTSLRNCDRLVELANGRIERIGSYSEIVENAVAISGH